MSTSPSPHVEPPVGHRAGPGPSAHETTVRRWIAAFNARDADTLAALAHEDVVVVPVRFVPEREYRGRDGVRRWIADVAASTHDPRVHVAAVHELDAHRLVAEGQFEGEAPFVAVYGFRDGLVATLRGYVSDARTLGRLGLLGPEEPAG